MKKILTLIGLALLLSHQAIAQTEQYFLNNDNPKEWAEKLAQLQSGAEWDAELRLPYPIIFIHGLVGDVTSWKTMQNWFENKSFIYGGQLNYCLNDDDDPYSNITTAASSDISQFVTNNGSLKSGDFYIINFDTDSDGNTFPGFLSMNPVQSNQAAIVKQGVALGHAIKSVLALTGRKKVVLMGHSMGGLCARMYIQTPGIWAKPNTDHQVAKFVSTGTPHGGSDVTASALHFVNPFIDEESDAVRDLRNKYVFSKNYGIFLYGGPEDAVYMDDFEGIWGAFESVDVSCNGIIGETFSGLNQRPIVGDIDFSCIINKNDFFVLPYSADLKNYRPINRELFYSEYDHTDLPKHEQVNIYALDEPDDYHLAYGIERNRDYWGFLTPQDEVASYTHDYDDYRFTMPQAGFVKALAGNLPPIQCGINIVRVGDEKTMVAIEGDGSPQLSTPLTWLPAGDYIFEVLGKFPNPFYWDNLYAIRLEHNGGSSPTTEPLPGLQVSLGPNPTTGPLSVTLSSEQPVEGVLSVVDFAGRTLHTLAVSGAGTYPLDLGSQAAGLYIITLRTADGVGAWTVVKE